MRSEERTRAALDRVNERLEELNLKENSARNRDAAHGINLDIRYALGAKAALMWSLEDLSDERLEDLGLVKAGGEFRL